MSILKEYTIHKPPSWSKRDHISVDSDSLDSAEYSGSEISTVEHDKKKFAKKARSQRISNLKSRNVRSPPKFIDVGSVRYFREPKSEYLKRNNYSKARGHYTSKDDDQQEELHHSSPDLNDSGLPRTNNEGSSHSVRYVEPKSHDNRYSQESQVVYSSYNHTRDSHSGSRQHTHHRRVPSKEGHIKVKSKYNSGKAQSKRVTGTPSSGSIVVEVIETASKAAQGASNRHSNSSNVDPAAAKEHAQTAAKAAQGASNRHSNSSNVDPAVAKEPVQTAAKAAQNASNKHSNSSNVDPAVAKEPAQTAAKAAQGASNKHSNSSNVDPAVAKEPAQTAGRSSHHKPQAAVDDILPPAANYIAQTVDSATAQKDSKLSVQEPEGRTTMNLPKSSQQLEQVKEDTTNLTIGDKPPGCCSVL